MRGGEISMSKIGFVGILTISILAALLLSSPVPAEDFGYIHCEYVEVIDGFQCQDPEGYNSMEWYAPEHVVTQEMIDYYVGFMGLEYNIPQEWPETFVVSGAPSGTYSGN